MDNVLREFWRGNWGNMGANHGENTIAALWKWLSFFFSLFSLVVVALFFVLFRFFLCQWFFFCVCARVRAPAQASLSLSLRYGSFFYIILQMWNSAAYIVNTCAIRTGHTQTLGTNFMHCVQRPQHLTLFIYSLRFGVHCLFFTVTLFRHLCAMLAILYGLRFISFVFSFL